MYVYLSINIILFYFIFLKNNISYLILSNLFLSYFIYLSIYRSTLCITRCYSTKLSNQRQPARERERAEMVLSRGQRAPSVAVSFSAW